MRTNVATAFCLYFALSLFGCASTYHEEWLPKNTLSKVDSALTFKQIKESPESHTGKVLLLGGEVLTAKRMKDHTRLMILQLPLDDSHEPVIDRMQSEGRFLAQEHDFLDPAVVPAGTRITVVGSVSGSHTEKLDEMDYTYPIVKIEQLKIWPNASEYRYGYYPYPYAPYGWYGPYYWHPYYFGPYGRSYYYW